MTHLESSDRAVRAGTGNRAGVELQADVSGIRRSAVWRRPGGGAAGPDDEPEPRGGAPVGDVKGEDAVPGSRPRPPRTLAVALLDSVLDALIAVRALARRLVPVRLRRDRRLRRGVAIASLAIVVGLGVLVVVLSQAPERFSPLDAGRQPDPNVAAPPPVGSPGAGFSPPPSPPAPTPRASTVTVPFAGPPTVSHTTPRSTLTARLTVDDTGLVSYRTSVSIDNPGSRSTTGWTLVVTLPRQTLTVTEVVGAQVTRKGATWTFVPDGSTRTVRDHGAVEVRFRVDGAFLGAAPTDCTIDGRACEIAGR